MKLIKNKKAQYFIFAAVFIIAVMLALLMSASSEKKHASSFNTLHNNYFREASIAINNNSNFEQLDNFTKIFLNSAKEIDPSFSLLYIYKNNNLIKIKNHLLDTITVSTPKFNLQLSSLAENITKSAEYITIEHKSNIYNFTISHNTLDLHTLFISEDGDDIEVFSR